MMFSRIIVNKRGLFHEKIFLVIIGISNMFIYVYKQPNIHTHNNNNNNNNIYNVNNIIYNVNNIISMG